MKLLSEHLKFVPEEEAIPSLMLGILRSIAQFERTLIRERQVQGIAKAKERGLPGPLEESRRRGNPDAKRAGFTRSIEGRARTAPGVSRATGYRYLEEAPAQPHTPRHEPVTAKAALKEHC